MSDTIEIEIKGLDQTVINQIYELAAEQDQTVDGFVNDMLREYINKEIAGE